MRTIEEVKRFVGERIEELNLSLNSLSLQLGRNNSYLFQFINRPSPKRLGEMERKQLAQILGVSEQDLCDLPINQPIIPDSMIPKNEIIKIDVLDVNACCGNGIQNISENVIGQQMMSLNALRELTNSAPESIKIIRAVGDSMMPTIAPNDVVWVDISFVNPTSDGLYLLSVGQELLIKRVQINPFDGSAIVKSDNPCYQPFTMQNYQEIHVLGRIIYHMRRMK